MILVSYAAVFWECHATLPQRNEISQSQLGFHFQEPSRAKFTKLKLVQSETVSNLCIVRALHKSNCKTAAIEGASFKFKIAKINADQRLAIWSSGQLSKSTKIRIFKSNVIVVLLYGCETWRITKREEAKPDTFLHKCLWRILRIYWPMRVSNEEVRRQAKTCTISEQIRKRRWRWIGHVLRMDHQQNPHIVLTWAPEGKTSRGRPRET